MGARLLFITIEFSAATFSGNGVHACSQVRALARAGHAVLVIAGRPKDHQGPADLQGACKLLEVELPSWGKLDRTCSWEAFAEGTGAQRVVQAAAEHRADAVLGVDWSSVSAYLTLSKALRACGAPQPPYMFMNYRVYTRTASKEDRPHIEQLERMAVEHATLVTALSRSDADYIAQHLQPPGSKPIQVVLPALRADMCSIPPPPDVSRHAASPSDQPASTLPHLQPAAASASRTCQASTSYASSAAPPPAASSSHPSTLAAPDGETRQHGRRRFLTCCVRLSPEKEPHRFITLVEALSASGGLMRLGVTPLLCGAARDDYACSLQARLRAAAPDCVIEERFLGPVELAEVYAATRLNVHPCLYDAYGMTVVEAASQGAPTLMHSAGTVGAGDLLLASNGEVLALDLSVPPAQLASQVEAVLKDTALLARVGYAAAAKARSWTEDSNAQQVASLVQAAVLAVNRGVRPPLSEAS